MKTVHEVSRISGVSVRTLHHYDAIGLLKPAAVTEAGYRLYDDEALSRLQTILLFRELEFPLKEIKEIIESPGFDRKKALKQQIYLLELQRKRLGELVSLARKILNEGINDMDFSAFDKTEIENYAAEAKALWGETNAYKEYESRAKNKTAAGLESCDGLMKIFAEAGKLLSKSPAAPEAQSAVGELRRFITENYYTCTPEILRGLGEMYVGDGRFKANIDAAGGEGTAEFVSEAIKIYCDNQ